MITELVNGFDDEIFSRFLNAKFSGSFSKVGKTLSPKNESQWSEVCQLGIVKTLRGTNNSNMPLLVVAAKLLDGETLKERSSRIKQFKFAKQVLDDAMSNPAPGVDGVLTQGLFVFHDDAGNFRLSLVYGRAEKTKLVWSTAKRLSFHVQAGDGNKTFRDRMALDWSSFDKLKEAFSVEKLTKEFYNRLFDWYQWALSDEMNVTYPNNTETDDDDREINEHIIRLITRLMFVWFLKQKHLVPDHLFDPDELNKILKDFDPLKGDNYYRAILQNLFFATLNSEIPERAFAVDAGNIRENKEHFDIKTLYRYGGEFLLPQDAVLKLFEKIPFLNGGLFECLDRGKNYSDGFSRDKTKQARLPNRLFFDSDKGLIPLLSQYHFTVEENSPGDEEVALDPELLGKVFENLLGAYNPETKVAARNATGSFYTPREIVNYMVDESLIAYLQGKLTTEYTENTEPKKGRDGSPSRPEGGAPGGHALPDVEKKLRLLFTGTEGNPFGKEETAVLDKALVSAKILDPACGSGAFPMGILLRMVELLRILRDIPEDASVYDLKLELIENCIYGGDIQCIAVQISKLRFFISLVCEQKPTKSAKDNYGIHTLPNLETKFVAADSLIGLPKSGNELPMANVEKLKKELWAVRHKHFLARTYQEKKELRREDKKLRTELAKALEQGGGFDTASAKLMADWDPYDQNTSAPFSDPEWMFNVKDGFDVVIGNPPYVQLQANAGYFSKLYEKVRYEAFAATADIYCLFYERGNQLLKKQGHLCFITSNTWMRAKSCEKLRKYLSEKTATRLLIDLGPDVFDDAVVDSNILLFQNNSTPGKGRAALLQSNFKPHLTEFHQYVQAYGVDVDVFGHDAWVILTPSENAIKTKIDNAGEPLKDWDIAINFGIKTGFNEAYIIDGVKRAELLAEDPKSNDIIKPTLRGRDVKKYYAEFTDKWIINTHNGLRARGISPINVERDYPAIYRHLALYEKHLRRRQDQGHTWANLRNCAYLPDFEKEKLVWIELVDEGRFAFDDEGLYCEATTFFMVGESIKYLAAILNSALINWYFNLSCPTSGMGTSRWKKVYVEKIPVPMLDPSKQSPFIKLIETILKAKKADPSADTSALEEEIDELVYDLYGLTPEERDIVRGAQKSSASAEAAADKEVGGQRPEDSEEETEDGLSAVASAKAEGRKSEDSEPKKKTARKRTPQLPPSLPGWD